MPAEPTSELPTKTEQQPKEPGLKRFIKGYLHNLNPKDKSWTWWLGTLGNAGLTGYLAIATGGSSLLLKSLATATASAGFHLLEKGLYSIKEKNLKKQFSGAELAEKIVDMRNKHANGVSRIAEFFGGMSAGAIVGGVAGIGLEAVTAGNIDHAITTLQANPTGKSILERIGSTHSAITESPLTDNIHHVQSAIQESPLTDNIHHIQSTIQGSPFADKLQEHLQSIKNAIPTPQEASQGINHTVDAVRTQIHEGAIHPPTELINDVTNDESGRRMIMTAAGAASAGYLANTAINEKVGFFGAVKRLFNRKAH